MAEENHDGAVAQNVIILLFNYHMKNMTLQFYLF